VSVSLAEIEHVYRSRGGDFFRLALARTSDVEAARGTVKEVAVMIDGEQNTAMVGRNAFFYEVDGGVPVSG
jgi:hypothetical protein